MDKNRMTLIASPNKVSAPSVGGNVNSSSIPKSTVAAVWQKQNTTEENVLQLQTKSTAATTTDCSTIEQPQNILHSSSSSNVNDLNSNNNCNNNNSNLLIQDVLCIKSYLHQLQKVLECQKQNELTSLPVDINSVNGGYQQGGKLYQNNNNLYSNNDEDAMNSNTLNQESEVVKLRRQLDILKQKNAEKDVMIAQMKTQLDESRLAKTSQHSLHHTPAFDNDTTTSGGNDKASTYTQTETSMCQNCCPSMASSPAGLTSEASPMSTSASSASTSSSTASNQHLHHPRLLSTSNSAGSAATSPSDRLSTTSSSAASRESSIKP